MKRESEATALRLVLMVDRQKNEDKIGVIVVRTWKFQRDRKSVGNNLVLNEVFPLT